MQLAQTTRVYFHEMKLVQGLKIGRAEQPCKDRGVSLFLLSLSVPEATSLHTLLCNIIPHIISPLTSVTMIYSSKL